MKRTSLIINIVLALAIVVLFVLHFTSQSGNKKGSGTFSAADSFKGEIKIAYINIDSLVANLERFNDLRVKFTDKQKKLEAELNDKGKLYQNHVMDFQNKVNKGLVTTNEANELQQQLGAEQQNLLALRDKLNAELAEEEQVSNRKLMNEIEEYLKEYTLNHPYHYILSYSFGGSVLYANDSLEITQDVLTNLNQKFKEEIKK
jgi:outer membrane protein